VTGDDSGDEEDESEEKADVTGNVFQRWGDRRISEWAVALGAYVIFKHKLVGGRARLTTEKLRVHFASDHKTIIHYDITHYIAEIHQTYRFSFKSALITRESKNRLQTLKTQTTLNCLSIDN